MDERLPFEESFINKENSIRSFSEYKTTEELLWHRDDEDRRILVINSGGWQLQIDDHIPVKLCAGDCIIIRKGQWHRVIAGYDKLIIKITRSYNE